MPTDGLKTFASTSFAPATITSLFLTNLKQTLAKKLWALCRAITRARYGPTCYTCYKTDLSGSDYQTGHFIAKSICSTELAYDLDNLRVQCSACNIWKSGNWPAFEEHLIADHGQEYVETLKRRNRETKGKKFDRMWFARKIEEYEGILDGLPETVIY